jgi:predicted transcriptional regulator
MEKLKVQAVFDTGPAAVNVDAFLEQVCLLDVIERGERDIAEGRMLEQDAARDRLKRWLE